MSTLITHSQSHAEVPQIIEACRSKIQQRGDRPHATVDEQLHVLDEILASEFGRFLLVNGGLNGHWTHEIVYRGPRDRKMPRPDFDKFIINQSPAFQASQQRFDIFQKHTTRNLRSKMTLASVPCGFMADLLTLDFNGATEINLVGIDLDEKSLAGARRLASDLGRANITTFEHANAWTLERTNTYDILTSNGLNIYATSPDSEMELYRRFHLSLRSNGLLLTSFLTPPPALNDASPWDMSSIDAEALRKQCIIFDDIIGVKWRNYSTADEMKMKLKCVGFGEVEIEFDRARMFPTILARKVSASAP